MTLTSFDSIGSRLAKIVAHTARCCTLCLIGILVARIRGRRQVGHSARLLDLGAADTLEELLVGRVLAQGL